MKNKFILLLCALLLAGSMTSCGGDTVETTPDTTADTTETVPETEAYDGLDAQDFGGMTFTIANRAQSANYNAHPNAEFDAPELTGEALNDGIFNRNQVLQEKYNITLVSVTFPEHNGIATEISKAVTSGDTTYNAAFPGIAVAFQMAMNGNLHEIHDVPHLQTDRAWWMTNVLSNTSIANKNYFVPGDMCVGTMNSAGIVYFNKTILNDYGLDLPYTLVDDDAWTLDAMTTMSAAVTHDANGDSILDEKDIYGTECSSFAWQPLFYGSGQLLIAKDENDLPYLDAASEQNYDAIAAVIGFLNNKDSTFNVNHTKGISDLGKLTTDMFQHDQSLFFVELLYGVPVFREMESDFGLLPLPKQSEAQAKYSTYLHPDNATSAVVPIVNTELDKTGVILEDMAFYSNKYVRPAFYDIMMKSKFARDNDSARMLDIILSNSTIDLTLIMKNSGIDIDNQMRNAATKGTTDILSTIAANEKKYGEILQKAVDALGE